MKWPVRAARVRNRPAVESLEERRLLSAAINGVVYLDLNGDGKKGGPGEHGVPNVMLFLDLNNNAVLDSGEPTSVTTKAGKYKFRKLGKDIYHVREILPDGYAAIDPAGGAWYVDLRFGASGAKKNFGYWPLSQGTPPVVGKGPVGDPNPTISVDLYNTGATQVNMPDGTSTPLLSGIAGEGADPYWTVEPPNPGGDPLAFAPTFYSFNPTRDNTDLQPGSSHPDSTWVSPLQNGLDPSPAGQYVFATAFDLTGLDTTTADVSGVMEADDRIVGMRLNGVSLSLGPSAGSLVPFDLKTGFVPGVNTLEVIVQNDTASPVALRVDAFRGSARKLQPGPIPLFNTGVATTNSFTGTNGLVEPTGGVDGHWLVSVPGDGFPYYVNDASHHYVYSNSITSGHFGAAFAAGDSGLWDNGDLIPSSPGVDSAFINPVGTAARQLPAGTYIYRTTFDLTGLDADTATVSGTLLAFGQVQNIFINGNATGQGVGAGFSSQAAKPFTITGADGMVSGINVLDIVVTNTTAGQGGIRVDGLRGTATGSAPRSPIAYPVQLPLPPFPPLVPPTGPFPVGTTDGGGLGNFR